MSGRQANTTLIGIVEDDRDLSNGLTSVLRASRFAVVEFESAESFLGSEQRSSICLLIVDMRLPGMSGLQLQRKLRREASYIPIIGISAHASESLQKTILDGGAVAFFSKPVRGSALIAAVQQNIGTPRCEQRTESSP